MKLYTLILILLICTACSKPVDPFLIKKHNIGLLTDSTQVKDLKAIFPNDSISKYIGGDEFTGKINNIEVFSKLGKKLLVLTPNEALDSTSTINTIQIKDSQFKTKKGITINSTFGDIEANYTISKIETTLSNIVVFVNEINAFFTIDKKELPAGLRFDTLVKVDAIQIPDNAKIKYFMIGW